MNKEQIVYVDGKPYIKAKVVMLPFDVTNRYNNTEGLIVKCIKRWTSIGEEHEEINKLVISKNCSAGVLKYYQAQHLYIISDEEIKVSDWFIAIDSSINQARKGNEQLPHDRKIIATTDKSLGLPELSQAFIEKYIEEYNKGNTITDVLVEINITGCGMFGSNKNPYSYNLKPDSKNTVTIRKQKDSWTREELPIDDLRLILYTINNDPFKSKYIGKITMQSLNNLNKWIEENL